MQKMSLPGWLAWLTLGAVRVFAGPDYTISLSTTSPVEGANLSVGIVYENSSAPATVRIRALPGSAIPYDPNIPDPHFADYDDYDELPVSESFGFVGDKRSYSIDIVQDGYEEDEEDFFIQVIDPSSGDVLEQRQVVIPSSDSGKILHLIPDNPEQVPLPDVGFIRDRGSITVNMSDGAGGSPPPGAAWRLVGETRWRQPGTTAAQLPVIRFDPSGTGSVVPHEVEFLPVPGYDIQFAPGTFNTGSSTDPLASQVLINDGGINRILNVDYVLHSTPDGTLTVNLFPNSVQSSATWHIRNFDRDGFPGDDPFHHGEKVDLPGGYYEIYFDPISILEPPRPRIVRVLPDAVNIIDATFLPNEPSGSGGKLPLSPVDLYDTSRDFQGAQATGQVRSNIAKTTGVAVASHTVLTSAQAVYNPKRLAFSYKVRWMLQRQESGVVTAKTNKTPTQIPRGYYIFNGYSDALADSSTGIGEVNGSRLDQGVAALFFEEPAARGGFAGYLGTPGGSSGQGLLDPNESKFMASYGLSEDTAHSGTQTRDGDLHLTPLSFSSPLDYSGSGLLFTTNAISNLRGSTKLGGILGSPVFVQNTANSVDLPAGILVGTYDFGLGLGRGLVFRAFDPELIQLVHRANYSGQTTRSPAIWKNTATSSSVISASSVGALSLGGGFGGSGGGGFGSESTTGDLIISLDPSGAVSSGARWGITSAEEYESDETVEGLLATDYTLQYSSAADYDLPSDTSATVVAEQTTRLSKSYTPDEELAWIQDTFRSGDWGDDSVVGPDANPDGDPYTNRLERALNGDPESSDDLLNLDVSSGSLSITVEPDTTQTDMTLTVYIGSTPSSLTTVGAQTDKGMTDWPTTARGVRVTDNEDGTYTIEDTNSGSARFMKVEATSSD